MGAVGGRSTGGDFSYFNLELSGDEGIDYRRRLARPMERPFRPRSDEWLQIQMGQELTHLKLLPGEEIRSPLVLLQFWKGEDWLRAQNIWRRWFIAHSVPKPGGKLPPTQWCAAAVAGRRRLHGVRHRGNRKEMDRSLWGGGIEARFLVDGRRLVSLRRRVVERGHVGSR